MPTININSPRRKRLVTGCIAGFLLGISTYCFAQAAPAGALPSKPSANGLSSVSTVAPNIATPSVVPPDIARVRARGELVVAMLGVDNPPFFYQRSGELVGLEVDLAKDIAKELRVGIRFDRSAKTFNEVVDLVARGEADLGVSKLSRTLARAQQVHFTTPYLTLNHALILNRLEFARISGNKTASEVVKNFKGSLAVIDKSSFADFAARNFPSTEIRAYANWAEALEALKAGKVTGAYRDEFEIKRLLKLDPSLSLTLRTITLTDLDDTLGIAVNIKDITLLSFVNQLLNQSKNKLTIIKALNAIEKP